MFQNRRRVILLVVLSLMGLIACAFTYRVMAGGTTPGSPEIRVLSGY